MKFLVHVCFNPETEDRPQFCDCRCWIGRNERAARIEAGELVMLDERNVAVKRNAKLKRTPRAATVEEEHIKRAYVLGSAYDRRRIEFFRPGALEKS